MPRFRMRVANVSDNNAPAGTPTLYNYTLQAADTPENRKLFNGNAPSVTISVSGCVHLPHGYGQMIDVDLSGQQPAPAPQAPPATPTTQGQPAAR
jgi:hypothetical protein